MPRDLFLLLAALCRKLDGFYMSERPYDWRSWFQVTAGLGACLFGSSPKRGCMMASGHSHIIEAGFRNHSSKYPNKI